MTIEYALLGFVANKPSHGYEIYRQLRAEDGLWQVWRIKQSQLYALLNRMEEEQLLTASLEAQPTRPARKVYGLTDSGRARFQAWLTAPVAHGRQIRIEFMAKLFFALQVDAATCEALLTAQQASCQQWRAEQERLAPPADSPPFAHAVHAFRLSQIDAFSQWLESCRAVLPDLSATSAR